MKYAPRQGVPIGRVFVRTEADEEVNTYVEFRDYNPRTNSRNGKKD